MQVTLIAGGVGGARMALTLHEALAPGELTVIGAIGAWRLAQIRAYKASTW